MPKEVIYPSTPRQEGDTNPNRPEVGWQPQCWVQLRIKGDTDDHISGLSVDVDRQQINRLIKTLRRARDAAYGHDE